ncbi:ATP-binding protein [Alistipes sp. OttesenSCG-928-L06]|nr:ATP-binding protein [Alistipes sp. OttesenSCG-928-L06]
MNDLSLHIIDIIQNSVSAGATRIVLTVNENTFQDQLTITIADNGRGMAAEQLARLADPFFTTRTTRRVGMGIPLFRQSAEQSDGTLTIDSTPGKGTTLTATFRHSHLDRPPLGDLAGSFVLMVAANPDIEFELHYIYNSLQYRFDTAEVKEALDGVPLNEPAVIKMLTEMVSENMKDLNGSL